MTRRSFADLEKEMRAVARGERSPSPPPEVAKDDPVGAFGVLTPSNTELLQLILHNRPSSVSELSKLAGRQQSNVSRSLQDLARNGLVRLVRDGMTIRPELAAAGIGYDILSNRLTVLPLPAAAE